MMKKRTLTLLILIYVMYLAFCLIWLKLDNRYFTYDSLRHFLATVTLYEDITSHESDYGHDESFFQIRRYPPGVYFINALAFFLFERSQDNVTIINTSLWVALLLYSCYQIGISVKDEYAGLFGGFLLLLYPIVFLQARIYMLDLALLSITTTCMYLFLKCDYFSNLRYSILLGIVIGLGLLVKINLIIFVSGPLIYIVFKAIFQKHREEKSIMPILANLVVTVLISTAISLPLYTNVAFYKDIIEHFVFGGGTSGFIVNTWDTVRDLPLLVAKIKSLCWFVWAFVNWQGNFYFFLLFVAGSIMLIREKNIRHKDIIFVWITSSYLFLAWVVCASGFDMTVTGVRYSMPILGGIALVTSAGLVSIKNLLIKRFIIGSTVIFGILNMIFLSYPVKGICTVDVKYELPQDSAGIIPRYLSILSFRPLIISGSDWISYPGNYFVHRKATWLVFDVLQKIKKRPLNVLVISNDPKLWILKFYAYETRDSSLHIVCDFQHLINMGMLRHARRIQLLDDADVVIQKVGGVQSEGYLTFYAKYFQAVFERQKQLFSLIKTVEFPDGLLEIYQREKESTSVPEGPSQVPPAL